MIALGILPAWLDAYDEGNIWAGKLAVAPGRAARREAERKDQPFGDDPVGDG